MDPRSLPALLGLAIITALLAAGCAGTVPPPSPPDTTTATPGVATTATPAVPTLATASPGTTPSERPTSGTGGAPSTEATPARTTCPTLTTHATRTAVVTPSPTSTAALTATATVTPTATSTATVTPTSTPPGAATYTVPELRYLLLDRYGEDRFFYCDPDYYPVAHGDELERALAAFPAIENDTDEFLAITKRTGLAPPYSDEDKLAIYREHKRLRAILLAPAAGGGFAYSMQIGTEADGRRVSGTVRTDGTILEDRSEPAVLTCPICLPAGTLIDTPAGPVPVEEVREGTPVWTLDASGARVAAQVLRTSRTPAPPGHVVVRVRLSDGREVMASPGHPAAEGRPVGLLRPGEPLDGARVTGVEQVSCGGTYLYDLLPAGATGRYWADGVLLGSTLS